MALKRRTKVRAQFTMSSLTDIVFLLLIFFMLTSTLVVPHALNVTLPKATSPTTADQQTVQLLITEDKEYYINTTKVPLNRLKSELRAELAGKSNPVVVINSDEKVQLGDVTRILAIVQSLDARVVLATRPE
jgi:biopolymer transport protein ExbD